MEKFSAFRVSSKIFNYSILLTSLGPWYRNTEQTPPTRVHRSSPFFHRISYLFPPLRRVVGGVSTVVLARLALYILGFLWIPEELIARKRGRSPEIPWSPQPGDIIVSNWSSWIDVIPTSSTSSVSDSRRTGTGSAAISTPVPIRGFRPVSFLSMIRATGRTPQATSSDIRKSAERPVVVFPECTTSNGRGISVPTKGYNVFVMCTSALGPQSMSVRMLPLSESPSSQLFMVSEIVPDPAVDVLSEACAVLIARIGRMKRVGFGWEDKLAFLDFYRGGRK
ncbi:hypothetical protein BU15DRAFT_84744 [Melanogaster broomeanus]|nr:hypothetical protein BU15DRAFT_84744 [Melanogaster broomeanus]